MIFAFSKVISKVPIVLEELANAKQPVVIAPGAQHFEKLPWIVHGISVSSRTATTFCESAFSVRIDRTRLIIATNSY